MGKNIHDKEFCESFLERKTNRPLLGFLWKPDVVPLKSVVGRVSIGNELSPKNLLKKGL